MQNDIENRERNTDKEDHEIAALLKDYPMPSASAEYFDQALVRATHEGTKRQRNRWMMAGFGSAIAAGAALWIVSSFLLTSPDMSGTELAPELPTVTMTLEEPKTINLVFASKEPLDTATLTVSLPAGVEMEGFPGQREVTWQTSLNAGRNLLPLKLIATSPVSGEVFATLEHNDRGRTFRVRVDVS